MSGLCGHVRLTGEPARAADVERQMNALAHRGPDRRRAWTGGPAALGHLLMRVTPEDLSEVQPLHDAASGLTLAADLRLDNRGELAAALALPAEAARDWPDSRVLLAAWKRWGVDCLDRIVGDFAIAVWDARARRLTLARDPLGQRPLYLHEGAGLLAFASEIKGLWALAEVPRALDEGYLAARIGDYFLGFLDKTHYRGIRMLRGGAVLTVDADGVRSERLWWEPRPDPAMIGRSEAEYLEAYRAVLGEAVACRLRGTRPAALIFSAGFDSGGIAALAGPTLRAQGRKLIALNSALPDGPPAKGEYWAREWVERCARDMPHLDLRLLTAPGLHGLHGIDAALHVNDGLPLFMHYAFADIMRTAAAAGARTIMDGQGGDYTLNPRGVGYLPWLLLGGRLGRFAREFAAFRRATPSLSAWRALRQQVLRPLSPPWVVALWERLRGGDQWAFGRAIIRPDFAERVLRETGADPRDAPDWPPDYRLRARSVYALELMSRFAVAWDSNMAAAHGLEMTRPFHDRRVVELALAIPEDLYVRDGRERHMARTALKDLLPPEYATRGRDNDHIGPDTYRRHKAIQPAIEAELARLESRGVATHMLDYAKIRAAMNLPDDHRELHFGLEMALHALFIARKIEWFQQSNQ